MAIVFVAEGEDATRWRAGLETVLGRIDFRLWPAAGAAADVQYALAWLPPPGVLAGFPNLRAIFSLGAGVDHLLRDTHLPKGVPICRIVDPVLTQGMTEYVAWAVLSLNRDFLRYGEEQRHRMWRPGSEVRALRAGVLGLGEIGQACARRLVQLGYEVLGWSRTPRRVDGITCFAGRAQLGEFLAASQVLVCLLPLTAETTDLLNADTMALLPRGAFLVNAGRGAQIVDADLIAALDSGQLGGAILDVFRTEPLDRKSVV